MFGFRVKKKRKTFTSEGKKRGLWLTCAKELWSISMRALQLGGQKCGTWCESAPGPSGTLPDLVWTGRCHLRLETGTHSKGHFGKKGTHFRDFSPNIDQFFHIIRNICKTDPMWGYFCRIWDP